MYKKEAPATKADAADRNQTQEELVGIIEALGLTPNKDRPHQIGTALRSLLKSIDSIPNGNVVIARKKTDDHYSNQASRSSDNSSDKLAAELTDGGTLPNYGVMASPDFNNILFNGIHRIAGATTNGPEDYVSGSDLSGVLVVSESGSYISQMLFSFGGEYVSFRIVFRNFSGLYGGSTEWRSLANSDLSNLSDDGEAKFGSITELWSGSKGNGGNITLSESRNNFDAFIFAVESDNNTNFRPEGKVFVKDYISGNSWRTGGGNAEVGQSWGFWWRGSFTGNTTFNVASISECDIKKIYGVKY